jgi:hypothetical protein
VSENGQLRLNSEIMEPTMARLNTTASMPPKAEPCFCKRETYSAMGISRWLRSLLSSQARRIPTVPGRVPQLLTAAFPSGFVRHPCVSFWP